MLEISEIKNLLVQFKQSLVKARIVDAKDFPLTARQLSKRCLTITLVYGPNYSYDAEIRNVDSVMTGLINARNTGRLDANIVDRKYAEFEHEVNTLINRKATYVTKQNEADWKYKAILGSDAFKVLSEALVSVKASFSTTDRACLLRLTF